jgi:hypothetical protein
MIPASATGKATFTRLIYYVLLESNQLMLEENYHDEGKAGVVFSEPIRHSHDINSLRRLQRRTQL